MEKLQQRKTQRMSFSIRKLQGVMASRSPSDIGTGGWPEVRLRAGRQKLSSELARKDRRNGLGSWGIDPGRRGSSGELFRMSRIE
ncbi:hypothetical protein MA16_Dca023306 [Dendrobium catenatum]|uniref:Uncharacterized protein n=1 Tax=Dendrobium catenatum TaxID=906689 RepID=A0A2I0WDZ0_9ASPA|nr:hypothetical protein MA16_Dca023306 [Dendrobium catenatum]